MIVFKGLKHYELGNAEFKTVDENLQVNNIISCGDGFSIKIPDINNWEGIINSIEIGTGQAINCSLLGKDGFNRLKTIAEATVFVNDEGRGCISVNSKLMSSNIKMIGKANGQVTFEGNYENPSCNCPENYSHENWLPIVGGALLAAYVLEKINFEEITERDGDGNVTSTTTVICWGRNGIGNFEDRNGNQFEADHIYIGSTFNFEPHIKAVYLSVPNEINYRLCNINQITLKNEIY